MGDVEACAPDWRDAHTYQPLLGADRSVWAWEFARRGFEQPGGAVPFEPQAGRAPELCFVGDGPPGDPLPIALWRWQSDGSAPVFSVEPASARDPAAIDLKGLDVATLVVRTADGDQHVLVSDGAPPAPGGGPGRCSGRAVGLSLSFAGLGPGCRVA